MDDVNTYHIQVSGQISSEDVEAFGPSELSLEVLADNTTRIVIFSDQSSMIGFIRKLHGLGLILLSIELQQ